MGRAGETRPTSSRAGCDTTEYVRSVALMTRATASLNRGAHLARILTAGARVLTGGVLLTGPMIAATIGGPVDPAAAAAPWSAPATLGPCPASEAPLVIFPSNSPTHATGPGAIVWDAANECPGGEGTQVAPLVGGDVPGPSTVPRTADGRALRLRGPLAASGGPYGRIVLAGSSAVSPAQPPATSQPAGTAPLQGELVEGSALGPFSAPAAASSESALGPFSVPAGGSRETAPVALTTAYLGDVALASPSYARDGEGVRLRVQRHRAQVFARSIAVSSPDSGRVTALTVALDYRSDALAVWRQGESIYARDLPASGRTRAPIQRLGPAFGPPSRIAALLSDDNRGIVAWSSTQSGAETSVYLDRSAGGVRFGAPQLLERFADPASLAPPDASSQGATSREASSPEASSPEGSSPRLVRLSSESVMLAWTGSNGSNWLVRTAAIDLNGLGAVTTISPAGHDSLLAALAPGPDGEALALWTEPQRELDGALNAAPSTDARPEADRQAIFAARGIDAYPARTIFGEPEEVAAPGTNSGATVAFDPDGGRAVAAWRGEGGEIDYSIRTPSSP